MYTETFNCQSIEIENFFFFLKNNGFGHPRFQKFLLSMNTVMFISWVDFQGENKKSILDADPEVQAMMEMTGKTLHSQGLREPEEDDGQ